MLWCWKWTVVDLDCSLAPVNGPAWYSRPMLISSLISNQPLTHYYMLHTTNILITLLFWPFSVTRTSSQQTQVPLAAVCGEVRHVWENKTLEKSTECKHKVKNMDIERRVAAPTKVKVQQKTSTNQPKCTHKLNCAEFTKICQRNIS